MAHGCANAFLDRPARPPAQGFDARGFQVDNWAIAQPTAFATRGSQLNTVETSLGCYNAGDLQDVDEIIVPQIENGFPIRRMLQGQENSRDTVPNIDKYLLPIIVLIVVVSAIPVVLEVLRARRAQGDNSR